MAGQYYWDEELEDELIAITTGTSTGTSTSAGATSSQTSTETAPGTGGGGGAALTPEQRERERDRLRHLTRHRELFLTRQPETLPATYIRGKCSLQMLADFESPLEYIRREVLALSTLTLRPDPSPLFRVVGPVHFAFASHCSFCDTLAHCRTHRQVDMNERRTLLPSPLCGVHRERIGAHLL